MRRGTAASLLLCSLAIVAPAAGAETAASSEASAPDSEPEHEHILQGYQGGIASLSGMVVAADIHVEYGGLELSPSPGEQTPDALVGVKPRLAGDGALRGAGARLTLQGRTGLRGGMGMYVFGASGGDLGHDALPNGVGADLGRMVVVDLELFLGFGIDAVVFEPYFELRGAADLAFAEVRLTGEPYGLLSTNNYFAVSPTLAPRLGAFVPIDQDFYLDVSGQYGFLGIERGGLFVGFGMWDNL